MEKILIRKSLICVIITLMLIQTIPVTISSKITKTLDDESGTYLIYETNITHYSFLNGTFDSTKFDESLHAIVLNNTNSGNYTSQIFDANSTASWDNISWVSNAMGELPNDRQIEDMPGGVDMTDNEVLYHFNNQSEYNENDTFLYDFSGSDHNGENTALLVSNGKFDGGIEFDGVSDHRIFIKDGMEFWDNAENWSAVMWIYARESQRNLIGKRDNGEPWIWIGESYRIGFSNYYGVYPPYVENVSSTIPYAVDPYEWTHLVMTRCGTNLSVYKNGVLHTSLTATTTRNGDLPGNGDLQIGAFVSSFYRFDGMLDELAFFSRTLSYGEIKNMYKRGVTSFDVFVSSCDDPGCVGESWIDIDDTSPQNLSVPNNRYFKYRFMFETEDISYSPELYNVTICYTKISVDDIPPEITNVEANPSIQRPGGYVDITCTVTDNKMSVDEVWVIIDYPDSSSHSFQMNPSYYYNKTYSQVGTYEFYIWANDTDGNSNTSDVYTFEIVNNPPNKPVIDGPNSGKPKKEYTYCIVASDPDDDDLYVLWSWGDGTSGDWLGPFESGAEVCESHIWNKAGTYTITVTLKDEYGSSITASKEITITKSKVLNVLLQKLHDFFEKYPNIFPILQRLLQRLGL